MDDTLDSAQSGNGPPGYRPDHKIGIITVLRLLYHVREAAWYNRPLGRQRAAPANRLGHKIGIITALRLLYHVREAAWYNCPSEGGCRVSGEPLGIARYNNCFAVIIP